MARTRQAVAWLLLVVAVGAAVLAALGVWTRRELLDSARVGAAARGALDDPVVRDGLAEQITNQIAARIPPEGQGMVPGVRQEIDRLVADDAFADAFEQAAAALHARLVRNDAERRLVLDLSSIGSLVAGAVERVDPRLVPFVDSERLRSVELGSPGDELPDLGGLRDRVDGTTVAAGAVAAAAFVGSVAVASRRHRIFRGAGILVAVAALAVAGMTFPAQGLLVGAVDHDDARGVLEALVDQVAAGLRGTALAVVAAGVLTAVAAAWWEHRPRSAVLR